MKSHVLHPRLFRATECERFVQWAEVNLTLTPGTVTADNVVDHSIRKNRVAFPDVDSHPLIVSAVRVALGMAGDELGLELIGEGVEVQYGVYGCDREPDRYDPHLDCGFDERPGLVKDLPAEIGRKASAVLQLSPAWDYAGGDLTFPNVRGPDRQDMRDRGSMVVFPAYLAHAVAPVISGVRRSLVIWMHGKLPFR